MQDLKGITADGLSFSYGKHTVFDGLCLSAAEGECAVIAGPNGSGKSTALSIIAGALKPTQGSVRINGRVGYVPQGTALFEDATVEENLKLFSALTKSPVPEALPFSVEKYLGRKVARLSGGMKKQVSIACALIGDPQVILLDEPCAALDIAFRDEMISIIELWKTQGKTVIYVGHDPAEFYSFFDTVVFLSKPPISYTRSELGEDSACEDRFTRFFKHTLKNIERK